MTKHIAFFNIPALGHVYPSLAIVAELVRRGHRVSYAAVSERSALIEAAGATVVPYRSLRPTDTQPDVGTPSRSEYVGRSLLNFLTEAESTLPQLEPVLAADRPDLVVFDRMAFAGRVFAQKYDIPTVQLWPMMLPSAQWSTGGAAAFDPTHPTFVTYLAKLEKFLANEGLQLTPEEFLTPDVAHHLAFFPEAFQYGGELFDERHSFIGPCIGPRAGQPAWAPPTDGRPIVLITLGTLNNRHPDFYRLCFAAFAETGWHVVMPVGRRFDLATLGPVPANVQVHAVVPQLEVLAHAKAFVSHAGMGGVMEALSMGVPQVAVARTPEQDMNAARVQQLGVGVRLAASDLTAAAVRDAVEQAAADAAVAAAVARMRHELLAEGGPGRAADIIEECLAGR